MAQETFVGVHHSFAVGLMTERDYQRVFVEDCFPHESGTVDYERAIRAGVRIFVFANDRTVSLPFIGTVLDLDKLANSGKIYVRWDRGSFYVPFTKVPYQDDEFRVTEDDFRLAFGPDCWTSVFSRKR